MPANDGISIIIPTFGRAALLDALLASVAADSALRPFRTEIILADSSEGRDRVDISVLAARYGATLIPELPRHAGLARNAGLAHASFDFILFVDSDVTLRPGTIQAHYDALIGGADACAGLTEFTGRATAAWRAIEVMQVMLPFRYPLLARTAPWAPTTNISFCRSALLAVGGFDPALPNFGGEDVDLGFRFNDAGFRIATSTQAIVQHTIETWAHWLQNLRRLASYGKADFYLIERHPSRTYRDVPSPLFAFVVQVLLTVVITPVVEGYSLLAFAAAIAAALFCYALLKRTTGQSLSRHLPGLLIISLLDLGKWIEAFRNRRFDPIFVRLRYLDDIIEKDWREIWATAWGIYASMVVFVLVFAAEMLVGIPRSL